MKLRINRIEMGVLRQYVHWLHRQLLVEANTPNGKTAELRAQFTADLALATHMKDRLAIREIRMKEQDKLYRVELQAWEAHLLVRYREKYMQKVAASAQPSSSPTYVNLVLQHQGDIIWKDLVAGG